MGRTAGCTVYVSVPTVDEEAWRALEPGTAHPLQRLRAVRQLRDAGVNVGVLMAPVVPGFTTQPAKIEATIKAIADHGAAFMGANVMYLKGGTKDHFMGFLASRVPRHGREVRRASMPGPYASADYVKSIRAVIDTVQERHGLGSGGREKRGAERRITRKCEGRPGTGGLRMAGVSASESLRR